MGKILTFTQYLFENIETYPNQNLIDSFIKAIKNTQKAEEDPRGSNKGEKVEALLKNVNVDPGSPWCAAFVYGVLNNTKFPPDIKSTIPKTAAVRIHWADTKGKKIEPTSFNTIKASSILPGMVFSYLTKKDGKYPGAGHTGIVLSVDAKKGEWTGVEGNANPLDGGREGYGTFIVTRKISDPSISTNKDSRPAKLLGFTDYFSKYRNDVGFTDALNNKLLTLSKELNPKTTKEIAYLKANPEVLKDYGENYKNRHKA